MAKVNKVKKTKTKAAVAPAVDKKKLQKWNVWLAFLCTAQAVAIVLLGTHASLPVATSYLAKDALASEATGNEVVATAMRHLFDVNLSWLIAGFLVAAAVTYVAQATFYRLRYEAQITRGLNIARWLGFGVSAGLLVVTLAMLSGVTELGTLVVLFGSVMASAVLAGCMERLGEQDKNSKALLPHAICGTAIATFVLPFILLAGTVVAAAFFDGTVSATLYGLYASVVVLFGAFFALTHFHLSKKKGWTDELRTESAYMLLGLAIVSIVAWQMFIGYLY